MTKTNLAVQGMSCQHCVMRVKKALDELPGVVQSDVSIGTAKISYDESKLQEKDLIKAVEKAGYKVTR